MSMQEILRNLPQIDEILKYGQIPEFRSQMSGRRITELVRQATDKIRRQIIAGELTTLERAALTDKIARQAVKKMREELQEKSVKVINGTGIVIHTNLGRSPISKQAADKVYEMATGYSNLEYSTYEGKRRSRLTYIEKLLTDITGAEAALIVNNNAAAVYLALNTLCIDKTVIVSRGELVEIGDSFRISEIVETSGCMVKEVGTTNKTYVRDVEKAIGDNTGMLLKMHTSNYKIVGFTENVSSAELVGVSKQHGGIPVMEDMGSGVLFDLRELGLRYERTVQEAVKDGVDIITFSGDKMLGGPQAGIIVGKKEYIDRMKKNQLMRCLRVDKLRLVALETTLTQYFEKSQLLEIPIYHSMGADIEAVRDRAEMLKFALESPKLTIEVKPHDAQYGGGSLPFEVIPSYAVYITSDLITASTMDSFLRRSPTPVVGTIQNDEYILDLRTIEDADFDYIGKLFNEMLS